MSKQLSISAAVSVFMMAAFVLAATPSAIPTDQSRAPGSVVASAFEVSLPGL